MYEKYHFSPANGKKEFSLNKKAESKQIISPKHLKMRTGSPDRSRNKQGVKSHYDTPSFISKSIRMHLSLTSRLSR